MNLREAVEADVALGGVRGETVEDLIQQAMRHGAEVLAAICQTAFARLLERGGAVAHSLFNPTERDQLAEALAVVRGTSELLGRSMIRDWLGQALAQEPVAATEALDGSYPTPLAIPICRQDASHTCGAAALQSVLAFHGVEESEAKLAAALGTDPVAGTSPAAILALVRQLGLPLEEREGLSLDDLAYCLAKGAPVLVPVQMHGGGHWVCVRGLDELSVLVMDPVDGETALGREAFEAGWKDRDGTGKVYERYGIAVGPRAAVPVAESILLREELGDGVPLLTPEAALNYFLGLTPTLGVDPGLFVADLRRTAFTLAVATDTELLGRVQGLIADVLRTGDAVSETPRMIRALLDGAGVSPGNPQYAEMVFRTNAMDSYTRGTVDEMRDPDVVQAFPVWRYSNPHDSRSRPEHAARNGNYYPNATEFTEVRGIGPEDACNCRCVPIPIYKGQWARLQAQGARVADGYALESLDLREAKDASGHEHAADGKFGSGGGSGGGSKTPNKHKETPAEIVARESQPSSKAAGEWQARVETREARTEKANDAPDAIADYTHSDDPLTGADAQVHAGTGDHDLAAMAASKRASLQDVVASAIDGLKEAGATEKELGAIETATKKGFAGIAKAEGKYLATAEKLVALRQDRETIEESAELPEPEYPDFVEPDTTDIDAKIEEADSAYAKAHREWAGSVPESPSPKADKAKKDLEDLYSPKLAEWHKNVRQSIASGAGVPDLSLRPKEPSYEGVYEARVAEAGSETVVDEYDTKQEKWEEAEPEEPDHSELEAEREDRIDTAQTEHDKLIEKMEATHEKAQEKAQAKYEGKVEKLDNKISDLEDAFGDAGADLDTAYDDAVNQIHDEADEVGLQVRERIETEEADDPEPEDEEDDEPDDEEQEKHIKEALGLFEAKDASGHEHAADGKFGSGGAAATTGAQAKKKGKRAEAGRGPSATPQAAIVQQAGRRAAVKEAVAGLKAASVKVGSAAARMGKAVWDKLPEADQQNAVAIYKVGHYVMHKAESAIRGGKALALEVARQRGLPDAHIEKVGRVLGIADNIAAWTVNMPATLAATGSIKLAKVASFLPLASAAYIAYSTARNPFAVVRAAKAALTGKLMKTAHEALDAGGDKEELAGLLLQRLEANGGSDWYLALLHAALDENGHDLAEAIKRADAAFAEQPEGPEESQAE